MRRFRVLLLTLAPAAAFCANPVSGDAKGMWATVKGYVLKSAEMMPEENYSFKPAPDVRSFGAIVAHVADGHFMMCGAAKGEKKGPTVEKTKTTKAEIIAALNESIAYCDAVYDELTDANGVQAVKFFGRDRSRIGTLQFNIAHDFEHYGNLVTYLRMNKLTPPSSQR